MISNFMLSVGHLNGLNRVEKQTELTLYSSALRSQDREEVFKIKNDRVTFNQEPRLYNT